MPNVHSTSTKISKRQRGFHTMILHIDNDFNIVIVTVSYELPSYYSFIRMGMFATYLDYKYVNAICTVLWKLHPYPLLQIK